MISGAGSLLKAGAGRLTLTGDNTYGSFTSIAEGTLQVAANNLPPGGLVFNFAELEFEQATTGLFSGMIAGPGSLTKTDEGQLTLTGENVYTGGTTISGGTLIAAATTGSATGTGLVVVEASATFGGIGLSSGATEILSGGTIAPSVSDGQMTLGGLSLASGATFKMGVGENLGSELIVLGSAVFDGDLVVELLDAFVPEFSDAFTLLTADSLSGSFGNVADGGRIDTLGGEGSFLVSYSGVTNDVVLSEFVAYLDGDFDFDGDVDGADFLTWQRNPTAGDLTDWQSNYGNPPSSLAASSSTVPEPSSMSILLVATAAIAGCCRYIR